jgi:site-specific recombinase XerD
LPFKARYAAAFRVSRIHSDRSIPSAFAASCSARAARTLVTPEKAAVCSWRREHRWHPHQLRHNTTTNLRREHGVELARIILGHANVLATQIYAEAGRVQAMSVISQVG